MADLRGLRGCSESELRWSSLPLRWVRPDCSSDCRLEIVLIQRLGPRSRIVDYPLDLTPGKRMNQSQALTNQRDSFRKWICRTVLAIAQNGVPQVAQLYADLVFATRQQLDRQLGRICAPPSNRYFSLAI